MNLSRLKEETKRLLSENPNLKDEILDIFHLACSEIEEGGSESHECELAYNDMLELVREKR